ncbi:unnamed protein product [Arabis nemorensis]|uniref:RRM domain-containing protein n=1 Tax=Arabis nemorensis TaxID=586526 RepID=A0A565CKD7_9BRAS|nr:unnamed protein product [Arabis nemorensis]
MSPSTVEKLHTFHAQERQILSKLVLVFSRPPAESLLVMATWLWLEDFGYENILSTIVALTDPLILALANEAISCFQCLDSKDPPKDFNQIPLTTDLMKNYISLPIIYKHRYTAITGIKNFLTIICSRIFSDILQKVLPCSSSYSFVTRYRRPLIIPGFPHPTFGSINVLPDVVDGDYFPNNNLFLIPSGIWGWNANCIATEEDRTMFITFSRGFPVSKAEVKELFTDHFGENCVECIYMREGNENVLYTNVNSNGQQKLFARLVLDSVTTVDRVLNGTNLSKFHIHRKHIWARKFLKRN